MKKTVIISCAGKGTRLGKNMPKCLTKINGKSIIEHDLEILENVEEIVVVVGFKGEEVISYTEEVNKKYNRNVRFIWNYDYENTATGASFTLGAKSTTNEFLIALDGDLIVHPSDMKNILKQESEFVCGEVPHTENPVFMIINENNETIKFTREGGDLEWSGLAGIYKNNVKEDKWYMYNIMEEVLPTKAITIRAREIDTPLDLEEATRWVNNNYDQDAVIDNFFLKRTDLIDNYVISRYRHNNRDEYDYDLIKKYITKESVVLDLGCGTGILEEKMHKDVKKIIGIDKYKGFLDKAFKSDNIEYISCSASDIVSLDLEEKFDLIMMWGVSIYLSDEELSQTIKGVIPLLRNNGAFIIKNQWGIEEELIVDKYSEELKSIYYAKYRLLSSMVKELESYGFKVEVVDIYPKEMNRWSNTHEYALICRR